MTEAVLPSTPQATNVSMRIAWLFAALAFLLQVAFSGRYGYFRDELYLAENAGPLAWLASR
jgi:hypothetical protein